MRYERPQTARRAAELLSMEPGVARILAGGTDVMVQLRSGVVEPDLMIDIKHIAGLRDSGAPNSCEAAMATSRASARSGRASWRVPS